MIIRKNFNAPPVCKKVILRYMGCHETDNSIMSLLSDCLCEAEEVFSYTACYLELPASVNGDICDFRDFCIQSKDLARNLDGCNKTILFAATVGVGIDRLIEKYAKISPSKALVFQAMGAERIEALCDQFCEEIKNEYQVNTRHRFSPGYGDLSLDLQKDIFKFLDCERKIGLTLNRSLLMTPTKSVTAFLGVCK